MNRMMMTVVGTLLVLAGAAQAAPFTPGNVVVVRMGTGTGALSTAATAVFLDEYSLSGALSQSIAMPTAASGANAPFANSGTSTSEGDLNLSTNGQFLTLAGYGAIPGVSGIVATTSANTPRVVARVSLAGVVDTSTKLGDAYNANNIRGAVSVDGSAFWTTGTATTTGGVRYSILGGTTSTQLNAALSNTRWAGIYNGQLYCSSASGVFQGVSMVGTGLPTTSGQTVTLLPGFPTATGPQSYDFRFADGGNTLYVGDDRTVATGGGVQKWTFNGGTWSLAYTLNAGLGTIGARGVDIVATLRGINTLVATTSNGGGLFTVIDTGAASSFTSVATATTNTVFRGVRVLPALVAVPCPVPEFTVSPAGPLNVTAPTSIVLNVVPTNVTWTYEWSRDGIPLANGVRTSGATGPVLTINPSEVGDTGLYTVLVTSNCTFGTPSSATGGPVNVTVGAAGPDCVNMADVASDSLDTTYNPNGSVGSEDLDAFIAGFISSNAAIADVASDSLDTTRNPNGSVGSEDLDAFIAAFIACS